MQYKVTGRLYTLHCIVFGVLVYKYTAFEVT